MQSILNEIIVGNIFAFLLLFMRFGMAIMIMPGFGDSFVNTRIRLLFVLAFTFVLTPILATKLPPMPTNTVDFFILMMAEALIGLFIGTVMRILISALDTAGMTVSIQAGFANAMVFNPVTSTQGSIVGAVYSMLGMTLLFVSNMHHFMLAATIQSYDIFPVIPSLIDTSSLAITIAQAVSTSFNIGIKLALPFIVVGLLVQIGFGLLGRLMPQIQIFFLALPVQILLSLIIISMVISAGILYWLELYRDLTLQFLGF